MLGNALSYAVQLFLDVLLKKKLQLISIIGLALVQPSRSPRSVKPDHCVVSCTDSPSPLWDNAHIINRTVPFYRNYSLIFRCFSSRRTIKFHELLKIMEGRKGGKQKKAKEDILY